MKPIQYLKTEDNHSVYKVNHELKRVTRICANRRTFPEYDAFSTQDLVKCRKDEWRRVENSFYSNNVFEWVFEGNLYKISDVPCSEKFLQNNDGTIISNIYPYLVWHNGFVWATYYSGNYYPRMPLVRIDNQGKECRKWTDIKYLKNFIKLA